MNITKYSLCLKIEQNSTLTDLRNELVMSAQERLLVVGYNAQQHEIGAVEVSVGTVNALAFNCRDIFAAVLALNAVSFSMHHNHPSGNILPSHQDVEVTSKIRRLSKELNLRFLGHFIVAPGHEKPREIIETNLPEYISKVLPFPRNKVIEAYKNGK